MRIRKLLVGEGLVGLAADVDKYDEIYRLGYVPRYSYGQVAMQCHDAMFLADTTPNCFTAEILLLRRCHHVVCIGIFFRRTCFHTPTLERPEYLTIATYQGIISCQQNRLSTFSLTIFHRSPQESLLAVGLLSLLYAT